MSEFESEPCPLILPLALLSSARLQSGVPVERPGVLYAHRRHYPPLLVFNWGDEPCLLMLEGRHAFQYFPPQLGHSVTGVLVSPIVIRVDVSSRYDSERELDPAGALVITEGKVCIVGIRSGETFADPRPVPIWDAPVQSSSEAKSGFRRWQIHAMVDGESVALWAPPTPDTAE